MAGLALAAALAAAGQSPEWRPVGGSAADLQLAGPATGPMTRVWFSADGSTLYSTTASGKVLKTQDFESWVPAPDAPPAPVLQARIPVRRPALDPTARIVAVSDRSQEVWGLGRNLYRSQDNGKGWETLTALRSQSIIGDGIQDVAISPVDPQQVVVADDYGIWRSLDGGLTWGGLNRYLPNLSVQRILATPNAARGARVQTERLGVLELPPGGAVWQLLDSLEPTLADEAKLRFDTTRKLGNVGDVTAVAQAGAMIYAGTSHGQIYVSGDSGATFALLGTTGAGAGQSVERIFVDPSFSHSALAVLSGDGTRVVRTITGGVSWDNLTFDLPKTAVHAVTAERSAGAVYVATDAGVFYARDSLEYATAAANWTKVSDRLVEGKVMDVRLDPQGFQLYAAVDGYGIFGAAAPHRAGILRLVSAADYSARPAAPGSLVAVVGEQVSAAMGAGLNYPVWNTPGTDSQIQVPFDATGSTVALNLTTARGATLRGDLELRSVSPAILVSPDGVAALFDADSGMPLDRNVAHPGQRIQIMTTGLGRVQPDWPTGQPAPAENTPRVVASVRAFLDRNAVEVTRATLMPGYTGFYLVEVQLPVVANFGAMELHVFAGSTESNHVQIVIGQ
jgi:uncharacterized protein (TIGR03437 family)